MSTPDAPPETLASIAKRVLHVPTLESRGADYLDFHILSCGTIEKALEAAYELGRQRGQANKL